ncbi:TPA: phage integrase family protein [Escherichia coli]|nr:tyrosine-type recombinase/integrase [Escherichia coli]HBA4435434.1 phage integrase family protein [Escherichia coli]HBI7708908.1 tyrosine-type recombinase/integrase [Escherichia coli]HDG1090902.1 tyrosine-type recombinase/integrase [Escherichia coli]
MNNVIPLQNSPERVSLLPIAPGEDFATALSLRRMATSTGVTTAYLQAPEVRPFSSIYWTSVTICCLLLSGIPECSWMLTPESFDLDGLRPFVRILSEKVRAQRGRPPKDEVRLVPLKDINYVRQMESWMITTRPRRREPLWAVTDETMRSWLKQAVRRDGGDFSIPVTPHTFRHSYIMHMLYHRQPRKVFQAVAGHRDPRLMEVYTRVFALDMAATLAVPFTGDGRDAAEILRTLPLLK